MRIIGGKLKGKSIAFVKSNITRPLKDSVKESIFNVIAHSNFLNTKVEKSNILDLYSGIGSFGLESLSRGAHSVTFVEKDLVATKILKNNLITLSVEKNADVVIDKIENFLKRILLQKYDLIFLDPPFAEDTFLKELKLIKDKKIYKKNHTIVIHRERKNNEDFKDILNPLVIKNYGRSKIIFGKFLD